jgi:hypothetical protein
MNQVEFEEGNELYQQRPVFVQASGSGISKFFLKLGIKKEKLNLVIGLTAIICFLSSLVIAYIYLF